MTLQTFKVGQKYSARSICDYNSVWTWTVKSRTAKRMTLITETGKEKVVGVRVSHNGKYETAKPMGSYSMCPVISAE